MDQNHANGVLWQLELGLLVLSDKAAELAQWDRVEYLIKGVEIVVFYLDNEFSYTNS
jgi:nicotinic acid mononucleotide adenylyltransferase